jgi:hypothetical protein
MFSRWISLNDRVIHKISLFVVTGLVSLGTVGCSADEQSRQLATQLRQLTAQYNAVTTQKFEAERQFYLASARNLDDSLSVVRPESTYQANPANTLAYGQIINQANAQSLKTAGDLANNPIDMTASTIVAFVQDGISSEQEYFNQAREEQAAAAAAISTDLNALEQYQSDLSDLTKQLASLETPISFSARTTDIQEIGQAVIKQLKQKKGK